MIIPSYHALRCSPATQLRKCAEVTSTRIASLLQVDGLSSIQADAPGVAGQVPKVQWRASSQETGGNTPRRTQCQSTSGDAWGTATNPEHPLTPLNRFSRSDRLTAPRCLCRRPDARCSRQFLTPAIDSRGRLPAFQPHNLLLVLSRDRGDSDAFGLPLHATNCPDCASRTGTYPRPQPQGEVVTTLLFVAVGVDAGRMGVTPIRPARSGVCVFPALLTRTLPRAESNGCRNWPAAVLGQTPSPRAQDVSVNVDMSRAPPGHCEVRATSHLTTGHVCIPPPASEDPSFRSRISRDRALSELALVTGQDSHADGNRSVSGGTSCRSCRDMRSPSAWTITPLDRPFTRFWDTFDCIALRRASMAHVPEDGRKCLIPFH